MNKREKRFLVMSVFGALLMASLGWVYAAGGSNAIVAEARDQAGGPGRLFACYMTYVRNGNWDAGACDILPPPSVQNLNGAGWGGSATPP
jgi:hypothetical protein